MTTAELNGSSALILAMPLASPQTVGWLRRKAPQLIIASLVLVVAVFLIFEVVEDLLVEGAPLTSGPIVCFFVSFTKDATMTVQSWGYGGVFVLMLLESSSLPIPSEVILPFAGYMVSSGTLNFELTVIVATAAGLAGSLIDYYIGYRGVHVLLDHKILGRAFFTKRQLETAAGWFSKHGSITVFLSRLVPGFRTLVSFPAGAVRMPLAKFVAFTTVGCLIWNALLIYVGVFLGENWRRVAGVSHHLILAVLVVSAAVFVGYLLWRRRRRKRAQTQGNVS
ncbi:MAG: DedA family protein [Candidatus Bathyarchaeota archaeon]|nr:DedA family protein [Candidatus Bathyarchaeota archaeon]